MATFYRCREELRRSPWRRFLPLGIVLTAMALFSFSSKVRLGTTTVLNVLHASKVASVLEHGEGRLLCGRLEGAVVCVSSRRPSALREALTHSPL